MRDTDRSISSHMPSNVMQAMIGVSFIADHMKQQDEFNRVSTTQPHTPVVCQPHTPVVCQPHTPVVCDSLHGRKHRHWNGGCGKWNFDGGKRIALKLVPASLEERVNSV